MDRIIILVFHLEEIMKKFILAILLVIISLTSGFLMGRLINKYKVNNTQSNPISNNVDKENSTASDKDNSSNKNLQKRANEILSSMSIEEKIGQMFLIRCNKHTALEDLNEYKIGGFILFDDNINGETKESLSSTIDTYQNNSPINLIIALDEEGGTVNRLSWYP